LLAGCSSNTVWLATFGRPQPNAQVHVNGGAALATVVTLAVIAASVSEIERNGLASLSDNSRAVPEMAPDRRISEQDCTKPIDYSLGNIRCK
jgi:hypothetical protein